MITISKEESFYTRAIFFLFGVGVMMIAPRTPDIKANLHVNNGTLGTLFSIGTIGSFVALVYMGQIVQRFGTRNVLICASTWLYAAMFVQPHIHSTWLFALDQIAAAMGWAGYHITINTFSLHRQKLSGIPILPKLHGTWSAGALITAVIAVGITSHITLAWHIDVGISIIWAITMYSIFKLRHVMIPGTREPGDSETKASVKSIKIFLQEEWIILIGCTIGIMLEVGTNDWATLYTKEDIGVSASLSILPYISFGLGMILGRLNLHIVYRYFTERFLIRYSAIFGGVTFIVLIQFASHFAKSNPHLGLVLAFLAFFLGGIGSAFISPMFTTIATRKSRFPAGFVVAQMALFNTSIFFFTKIIISWIAQSTSITTALMVPGVLLLVTSLFAKLGSEKLSVKR